MNIELSKERECDCQLKILQFSQLFSSMQWNFDETFFFFF